MTLSDLVDALSACRGPVLTWYGGQRVELGGPVAARWLAKTANLLSTELRGDLFDTLAGVGSDGTADGGGRAPEPTGTLRVDLGRTWQGAVWTCAAWLSGWRTADEGDPDVWVAGSPGDVQRALGSGTPWVLAQAMEPLALSWRGPLPDGAVDALAELMGQPDSPVDPGWVDWEPAGDVDADAALVDEDGRGRPGRVLLLAQDTASTAAALLAVWARGGSAVVVDPGLHDAGERARIAQVEGAHPVAP